MLLFCFVFYTSHNLKLNKLRKAIDEGEEVTNQSLEIFKHFLKGNKFFNIFNQVQINIIIVYHSLLITYCSKKRVLFVCVFDFCDVIFYKIKKILINIWMDS